MNTKKIVENKIDIDIYDDVIPGNKKWLPYAIILFLLGFLLNFPIKSVVANWTLHALKSMPGCSIDFSSLQVEFFLPKIILKKPIIPGYCFGNTNKELRLEDLYINFRGPSFYPLGIKLYTNFKLDESEINVYTTLGISSFVIKIEETEVNLKSLTPILGDPQKATGKIKMESLTTLDGNKITDLKLALDTSNLMILPQSISNFNIPKLDIGELHLRADYDKDKLVVKDLIIGNDNSPIIGKFTGNITINQRDIQSSKLDLSGEIRFSDEFLNNFSILNLVLNQYRMEGSFYQVKIRGTFRQPVPSSL